MQDARPPPPLPGEVFGRSYPGARLSIQSPLPLTRFGTLHVTSHRLSLTLLPPPPGGRAQELSLPLSWLLPAHLTVRRPLLGAPRVDGELAPAPGGGGEACVVGAAGGRVGFKVELLDIALVEGLCEEIRGCVRAWRGMRGWEREGGDARLVETDVHTAFVDPQRPGVLLLVTHLAPAGGGAGRAWV